MLNSGSLEELTRYPDGNRKLLNFRADNFRADTHLRELAIVKDRINLSFSN
jgi:hypothetical protein